MNLIVIIKILGGFLSSAILWLLYMDMEKSEQNAGIFATYPRTGISMPQGLFTFTQKNQITGVMRQGLCHFEL